MPPISSLTVAILAGGMGTRLRPVVSDLPKVLAEINGVPFIIYLLDYLQGYGVGKVVMCTGYRSDMIEAVLGHKWGPLHLEYSIEEAPLGTGGALRKAMPLLQSDPILVVNGDSYSEIDLDLFCNEHLKKRASVTMALCKVPDTSRFGRVELHRSGQVAAFREKEMKAVSGWINAGMYLIRRGFLKTIPPGQFVSLETNVFPRLLNEDFYGYRSRSSRFIDIGTPDSFLAASQFFSMARLTKQLPVERKYGHH